MTVTAVSKDPAALTMTLTAEFDASPERVWQLWADPRQLERWWGPPSYPATVTSHDLRPGGRVLVLELREHDEAWVRAKLGDHFLGFSDDDLCARLTKAGFSSATVRVGSRRTGDPFTVLIATGTRS